MWIFPCKVTEPTPPQWLAKVQEKNGQHMGPRRHLVMPSLEMFFQKKSCMYIWTLNIWKHVYICKKQPQSHIIYCTSFWVYRFTLQKQYEKMYRCFFIFGVVLGARHKFATTGKLRVVTIVYAKVEVGITIWQFGILKNTSRWVPQIPSSSCFWYGNPGSLFVRVLIFETRPYRCNICLLQND